MTYWNSQLPVYCLFDPILILFNFFLIYKYDVRIKHDQIDEMILSKSLDDSQNPTIWRYRPIISSLVSICLGVCFTVLASWSDTNSSLCSIIYAPNLIKLSKSSSFTKWTDENFAGTIPVHTVTYCLTRISYLLHSIFCVWNGTASIYRIVSPNAIWVHLN